MDVPKTADSGVGLTKWYSDYWTSLRQKERASLFCVAAHSANYLIPLSERPVRAITILRDPVDRVLSRYHFFGRPRDWTLADYYLDPDHREHNPEFFNGQARSILEPHFDVSELSCDLGPGPDADIWRTRLFRVLSEYYVVGIQERFLESIRMIARELGWLRTEVPALRVNARRPRGQSIDTKTYELTRAANWLDVELHAHYVSVVDDLFGQDELEPYKASYITPKKTGRVTVKDLSASLAQLRGENLALRTRITGLERKIRNLEYADAITLPRREKRDSSEGKAKSSEGKAKSRKSKSSKSRAAGKSANLKKTVAKRDATPKVEQTKEAQQLSPPASSNSSP